MIPFSRSSILGLENEKTHNMVSLNKQMVKKILIEIRQDLEILQGKLGTIFAVIKQDDFLKVNNMLISSIVYKKIRHNFQIVSKIFLKRIENLKKIYWDNKKFFNSQSFCLLFTKNDIIFFLRYNEIIDSILTKKKMIFMNWVSEIINKKINFISETGSSLLIKNIDKCTYLKGNSLLLSYQETEERNYGIKKKE